MRRQQWSALRLGDSQRTFDLDFVITDIIDAGRKRRSESRDDKVLGNVSRRRCSHVSGYGVVGNDALHVGSGSVGHHA
jgi:hypothetical protein